MTSAQVTLTGQRDERSDDASRLREAWDAGDLSASHGWNKIAQQLRRSDSNR
jgi:hypothetical protein